MILHLDDDPRYTELIAEEFEGRGLSVRQFHDVDEALALLNDPREREKIEVILWDLAMPTGNFAANPRADRGRKTGELFYECVRELLPDVPMVLLTNRGLADLDGRFMRDANCESFQKVDRLPIELGDLIEQKLKQEDSSR